MPDRYDVSGNSEAQYMDAAVQVMKNKKGIESLLDLQDAEEEGLIDAYILMAQEVTTDTPLTTELILYTHGCIFGDLYEWAGRFRTVRISKPGVSWPPPDFLDMAMHDFERTVLERYQAITLGDDAEFCSAVGHIQGEFLAIHPFREGNARTIKLISDLLALQTDRPILRYDMSEHGRQEYIDAAKGAFAEKDYKPMTAIVQKALIAARQSGPSAERIGGAEG